jgi:hypothetical protein
MSPMVSARTHMACRRLQEGPVDEGAAGVVPYAGAVSDLGRLDDELRLVSVVRRAIESEGGRPSTAVADRLLDERIEATGGDRGEDPRHVCGD